MEMDLSGTDQPETPIWHRDGHRFIGRKLWRCGQRAVENKGQGNSIASSKASSVWTSTAVVVAFIPASENGGLELFHLRHDDEDEEILDTTQMAAALRMDESLRKGKPEMKDGFAVTGKSMSAATAPGAAADAIAGTGSGKHGQKRKKSGKGFTLKPMTAEALQWWMTNQLLPILTEFLSLEEQIDAAAATAAAALVAAVSGGESGSTADSASADSSSTAGPPCGPLVSRENEVWARLLDMRAG